MLKYLIPLLLLSFQCKSQVYTFHKVTVSNFTKIDSNYFFESFVNYDSAWVGLSDLGVIYIDLCPSDECTQDTPFIKIMDRCLLEDSGQFNVMDMIGSYPGSLMINTSEYSIDLRDPEIQWDIEWVGDYFDYTRDVGFNPQIESIEEKNKGVLFQPVILTNGY